MSNIQYGPLWWPELFPAVLFGPPEGQTLDLAGVEMIRTLNGVHYPCSLVSERVHLFADKPIYDQHHTYRHGEPQKIGRVFRAWWDPKRCEVRGIIEVTNPAYQQHLESLSPADLPGLSPVFVNIKRGPPGASLVEQIRAIRSIDLTDEPYSGGRLLGPDAVVECILRCMEFHPSP